ncbi:hypothetical protein M404DRAFT_996657 [Pisolithus tinctorius Marx 270]|uniref:Uncharacterized protein n=1 Tax=Pisolithus tinctorius Marx 270 TaxID=870435 RepID=A0A0C3JKX9_PISTI|nr:hypothetical protein M404DRAFT_996657 [Pisolithus tinctorius Marx 270]
MTDRYQPEMKAVSVEGRNVTCDGHRTILSSDQLALWPANSPMCGYPLSFPTGHDARCALWTYR